ncbi:uncharacterized protein BKA55DRAFT_687927 [Fusarium redolens]|uniref:Pectinesterase n=1 Tax=Fusarium redolens TaxID=48865 RepID=A0A9P9HL97_FUSRE|nr:uncharacterized protein BKA55DRAFT_687927 [Fusarium redolens]KAH7259630.1 hypothetical protein BKA55DRAFT_687927 [Fusarium redolens]
MARLILPPAIPLVLFPCTTLLSTSTFLAASDDHWLCHESVASDADTPSAFSLELSATSGVAYGSMVASEASVSGDLNSFSDYEALHSFTTEFPSPAFTSSQRKASESVVSTSTGSPVAPTITADESGDYIVIEAAQKTGHPTAIVVVDIYTENRKRRYPGYTHCHYRRSSSTTAETPILHSLSRRRARGQDHAEEHQILISQARGSGGAVLLQGSKNAFYNCQSYAAGIATITGSYAPAIIANSEALTSNGLLFYNKDALAGSTPHNSTIVFDTCDISQKSGPSNTRVSLNAGSGNDSVSVFNEFSLGGFLAASGVYVDTKTQPNLSKYIDYSNQVSDRSKYVTLVTDPKDLAPYEISAFFKSAYPSVAVSSLDWIDQGVLSTIQANNAKDFKQDVETTTSAAATTSESSPETSESATTTSDSKKTTSESLTKAAARHYRGIDFRRTYNILVLTAFSCPQHGSRCRSQEQPLRLYIYILIGTYQGQVSVIRTGATVFRGEAIDGSSPKNNKVTITARNAGLSSSGCRFHLYWPRSNAAFVISFLDGHISGAGWKIASPAKLAGTFTEGNDTGPGWGSSARNSPATVVSDNSLFSAASILGSDAWIEKAAISSFPGWPYSVCGRDTAGTTITSSATTASSTTSATDVGAMRTPGSPPTGNEYKTVDSALVAILDDGQH